jgi:hypothetical protein
MTEYQYEKTIESHLKNWMKFLTEDGKLSFNADLDNENWYSVILETHTIAVFQIVENKRDDCYKNLEIKFNPHHFKSTGNSIKTILFIYESMLDICEDKNIFKLKLHIKEKFLKEVLDMIVEYEIKYNDKIKNLKYYGAWIDFEISKK